MTVKSNITDIIVLVFITMLTAWSLFYGFTIIPTPAKQQAMNYDIVRAQNLKSIETGITAYYQTHGKFPDKLSVITEDTKYIYEYAKSKKKIHLDPQSSQTYEFIVEDKANYKLCATFGTDTTKEEENTTTNLYSSYFATGSTNNEYAKHEAGRKCFDNAVPDYYSDYLYPTPTFACLGASCPGVAPTATQYRSNAISPTPTPLK